MSYLLDETDKKIVQALQDAFPIVEEPFKELAKNIGINECEFIERAKNLKEIGAIRKMGAVLRHREIGFKANSLTLWKIPEEKLETVAKNMSQNKIVTHCYNRTTTKDWNYNLYTMIHGESREECENIAKKLKRENNIEEDPLMLYSTKEWKKTGMKYFAEASELSE